MPKWLWILNTTDKFQLPLYVADSARELAEVCGVSFGTVSATVKRRKDGLLQSPRYVSIRLDDDLAEELERELAEMDKEVEL